MQKELFYKLVSGNKYYTQEDLRYNQKIGYGFSKEQYDEFVEYKKAMLDNNDDIFQKIPLKMFNSKYCFYSKGEYLQSLYDEYINIFYEDSFAKEDNLFERNMEDLVLSRIFSEVEGTLRIENVPTTHKRIKEIYQEQKIESNNDIIIKNMLEAMRYIVEKRPSFDKENLRKLYCILSDQCLAPEDRLQDDMYYRNDGVSVGGFDGAEFEIIDMLMDSLFDFVNDKETVQKYKLLLPHICHYYIVYVHPYFDYNGRTARMVSFWINHIFDISEGPLFMSEAINENKTDYYKSLANTRIADNDLTYFLGYILETAIKFSYIYKNLEEINNLLSKRGDFLSKSEIMYLKKILIHNPNDYFNLKMFFGYINSNMTKQGGMKILNSLTEYNILLKQKNRKGDYIFKINPEFLFYKIDR